MSTSYSKYHYSDCIQDIEQVPAQMAMAVGVFVVSRV